MAKFRNEGDIQDRASEATAHEVQVGKYVQALYDEMRGVPRQEKTMAYREMALPILNAKTETAEEIRDRILAIVESVLDDEAKNLGFAAGRSQRMESFGITHGASLGLQGQARFRKVKPTQDPNYKGEESVHVRLPLRSSHELEKREEVQSYTADVEKLDKICSSLDLLLTEMGLTTLISRPNSVGYGGDTNGQDFGFDKKVLDAWSETVAKEMQESGQSFAGVVQARWDAADKAAEAARPVAPQQRLR